MSKQILSAISLFFCLIGTATAQVPVTDIILNQQTATNQIANIAKYAEQIVQLKAQLDQAKQLYDQLNGLRNVGSLMNNQLLAQYLPPDYQKAFNALKSGQAGSLSGISGTLNQIASQYRTRDCNANNFTPAAIANCKAQQQQAAMNQYVGEQGYQQSAQNIQNLQQFVNSINSSSDAKSLQDLQARIAVEQVKLQNEQVKLQTIAMMQKAQEDFRKQNASENTQQMLQPGTKIHF